jgi:hypothetical protein
MTKNAGGRPRKPASDDPRIERRRQQYRLSQLRKHEKERHAEKRCRRELGRPCPLKDPIENPTPLVKSRTDGPMQTVGEPFNGRRVYLTPEGRRVWIPSN